MNFISKKNCEYTIDYNKNFKAYARKLKIVHMVSSLMVGGMERFVLRLAKKQIEEGHLVSVIIFKGGELEKEAQKLKIPVKKVFHKSIVKRLLLIFKYFILYRADIVHVHNPTSLHYAMVGKMFGARIIMTDHGQCQGFARTPHRFEIENCNAIVSVSEDVAKRHGRTTDRSRNFVIYNGVSSSESARNREEIKNEIELPLGLTGIIVARLEPIKAHGILLNAIASLSRKRILVNLIIAGDGSERNRLEEMIQKLELDSARIRFLGYRQDIPDLLSVSDFFVLSSLQEGLPLAILEAMTHGLPIIATAVGGVPEIISHEINGLLVSPNNSEMIASAIERFAIDYELRKRLGLAAKRVANDIFGFDKMNEKYEALYNEICNKSLFKYF